MIAQPWNHHTDIYSAQVLMYFYHRFVYSAVWSSSIYNYQLDSGLFK